MKLLIKYLHNAFYSGVPVILGIIGVWGEQPIAFVILSLWAALVSVAYYRKNLSMLKILTPDYSKVKLSDSKMAKVMSFTSLLLIGIAIFEAIW